MIEILEYSKNPLDKIGKMASICYDTKLKDENHAERIGKHCINAGHGRNLEFARITIKFTCSSRVGREIYTSIGGSPTRLQASTRYITYDNFNYFTPKFDDMELEKDYHRLMHSTKEFYKKMKDNNVPNDITGYVLPLALETTIVWEGNARTLETMFNQRLCYRALDEYRVLMKELKVKISQLDSQWKWLSDKLFVPKCVKNNKCDEGKKDCVLYNRFNNLK